MKNVNFKNYTVIKKLGQGGMATVYLAEHNLLRNKVAVKVLNKEFFYNSNIKNRFISEARKMVHLDHPNIVRVTDLIDNEDQVAFVMEYLEGESLKEVLQQKKLNDSEIEDVLKQMVSALSYVHEEGLIHRDVKPSNFIFDKRGNLKLTDFGISKDTLAQNSEYTQTATHINMGTPMYMSPEQIRSLKDVTKLTDIYSLGVVLWEMVTGKKPYNTQTLSSFDLQLKIVNENLPLTYTKWDGVIQKATQKAEEDRLYNLKYFLYPEQIELEEGDDDDDDDEKTVIYTNTNTNTNKKEKQLKPKSWSKSKDWLIVLSILTIILIGIYQSNLFSIDIFNPVISSQDEVVLRENYFKKYDYIDSFEDNLAGVKLGDKWGLIDKLGIKVTPLKYDEIGYFKEGFARVNIGDRWGFINNAAEEIIPIKYHAAEPFNDGLAKVILYSKKGFIDKSGVEVIPLKYDSASSFSEGLASVGLSGERGFYYQKYGFINKSGVEVIPIKYDYVNSFRDGLAVFRLGEERGFINKSGIKVISLGSKYDYVEPFYEGLSKVLSNNKIGFIDKSGVEVIPLKYDLGTYFSDGLARVRLRGKWGFVNQSGVEVTPLKYDEVDFFREDMASVELNDKWGFINKSGIEVIPLKYDRVSSFNEGLASVRLNGNWSFIDMSGNKIISLKNKYDYVSSFYEGIAEVRLNGKVFYINKNEDCISRDCP